ncbi:unnamed protein product, partial [marine sediment metagenome]
MSAETQAQYGRGPAGTPWNTPVVQTQKEMEYWKAQSAGDPNVRFSQLDDQKWMMQTRSEAYMTTAAAPVAPEFMGKMARYGVEESTALQSSFPALATFLGIGKGQSPYATGSRPSHMEAWDKIADVWRYNEDARTRFRSPEGEDIGSPLRMPNAVELTAERKQVLQTALAGGAPLEELGNITAEWGQGPLYNPSNIHGQQYFPQGGSIMASAAFENTLEGEKAIDKLGRNFPARLGSFIEGEE